MSGSGKSGFQDVVWLDDHIHSYAELVANFSYNHVAIFPTDRIGEFLELVRQVKPHAAILDLILDGAERGEPLIRNLQQISPQTALLIYTATKPVGYTRMEQGVVWIGKDPGDIPDPKMTSPLVEKVLEVIEAHRKAASPSAHKEDVEVISPTWIRLGWLINYAMGQTATLAGAALAALSETFKSQSDRALTALEALHKYALPLSALLIFLALYFVVCPRLLLNSKDRSDFLQRQLPRYENDPAFKARIDACLEKRPDLNSWHETYYRVDACYTMLNTSRPRVRALAALCLALAVGATTWIIVSNILTGLGA